MRPLERLLVLLPGLLDEGLGVLQRSWPTKVLFAVWVQPLMVIHAVLVVHIYWLCFLLERVRAIVALHKFLRHCYGYNKTIIIDRELFREVDHV